VSVNLQPAAKCAVLSQLTSHPYQKAPSPLSSDAAWQEFVSGDPGSGGAGMVFCG